MSHPPSDRRHTSAHARTPSEKRGPPPTTRPASTPHAPSLSGTLSPPPVPEKRKSWLFGGGRQHKSKLSASTPTSEPVLEDEGDQLPVQPTRPMIQPTPEADLPEWMALAQHAVGSFCLLMLLGADTSVCRSLVANYHTPVTGSWLRGRTLLVDHPKRTTMTAKTTTRTSGQVRGPVPFLSSPSVHRGYRATAVPPRRTSDARKRRIHWHLRPRVPPTIDCTTLFSRTTTTGPSPNPSTCAS
jgi:hypothetical protein